eukprot:c12360_g1_i2.p1 GENE.c12360_g1_i2~~c12360_g1_i2.p1  ORF type:complete len:286 (-),score=81.64 c12360_g1_i2:27-884(-)
MEEIKVEENQNLREHDFSQPVSYFTGCSSSRVAHSPMSMFVVGLVLLTYIPYVIGMDHSNSSEIAEMVFFHLILALMIISYLQCVAIDAGSVPEAWEQMIENESEEVKAQYTKCRNCLRFKPPRSHYDSITRRLVLNMDHFCPWVVNTVGFYNRKFFILFLFYTCLACLWFVIAIVVRVAFFSVDIFHISGRMDGARVIAFAVDGMFLLVLGAFLEYHLKLVINNETTIDEGQVPEYNVGWRKNVEQVFGRNKWLWLVPVFGDGPVGDGVNWPTVQTINSATSTV